MIKSTESPALIVKVLASAEGGAYRADLEAINNGEYYRVTLAKPHGRFQRNTFIWLTNARGWFETVKIDYSLSTTS